MSLTAMLVTGGLIAYALYDLVVIVQGGVGTSISRFMQRCALRSPIIAFTVGFICGHIFGYMAPEPESANPIPLAPQVEVSNDTE